MTWLHFTASTMNMTATLILSFVLMSIHENFKAERAIDQTVIDEMEREQLLVLTALIMMALSWVLVVFAELQEHGNNKKRYALEQLVMKYHKIYV